MESIRRAVIDVGTNSIKLLIADVRGRFVYPICETSRQTRLGKDFYETRRLQSDAMARTAEAVAEFAKIAREKESISIRVIATSAARDAMNADELISAIQRAADLKTEIISGEREAELVFRGVVTDDKLAKLPLLIFDVGGGSTEFILGQNRCTHFAQSFPLGTVRLLEQFPHRDPPTRDEFKSCRDWTKQFLQNEIRPKLEPPLRRENQAAAIQLVGTGGTATILARMELKSNDFEREQIEAAHLNLERLKSLRENLWSLPLAGRQKIIGLPKSRADVILTGALIYETVMEEFGFKEFRVSTRGLRFAAVME